MRSQRIGRLGLLVALNMLCACQALTAEPLVQARPVPLQEDAPARLSLDALRFEAGFQLGAADPRFGGLSGVWLAPDGRDLALASDRGTLWRATLQHDGDRLAGFADWQATPLHNRSGGPIDAEALADDGAGGLIVAVEGPFPLRRIAPEGTSAPPEPLPAAVRHSEAGAEAGNAGIEALTALADGSLLAVFEGVFAAPGQLVAWHVAADEVTPLRYEVSDGFVPTGADRLDDTIYLVERRFSMLDGGFASRIVALDADAVRGGGLLRPRPLAVLGRPAISENFEAIAARRGADGRVLLYLVADDNFLVLQRTLVLQFSLAGP